MQTTNNIALKEWDVVCAALAAGQQRILLRKGGIHEGPDGFQPDHSEFWLYPTAYHQSDKGVRSEFVDATASLPQACADTGSIPIRHYARVEAVHHVENKAKLPLLRPFHIYTDSLVYDRFEYKEPGLWVLVLTVWSLPQTVTIPHDPRYDGCRSWVTLNDALSTEGLQQARRRTEITDDIDRILNR